MRSQSKTTNGILSRGSFVNCVAEQQDNTRFHFVYTFELQISFWGGKLIKSSGKNKPSDDYLNVDLNRNKQPNSIRSLVN